MADLNGKVAVITGAGAGIGQSIAKALARAGALTVIPDLNRESALRTAAEIEKSGTRSLAIEADVTKAEQVESIFDATLE
ncbi:MAG: SDR family NAD(P)-dependent oxidoreductase, partial [Desulfomonilia bacterium]